MNVIITPSKAIGVVNAPPSKSMAHRALICGALSKKSLIKNVAFSKDIEATLNCLQHLGAEVKTDETSVEIGGLNIENIPDGAVLNCNESGSTLRFLLPLCMACGKEVAFKGSTRLFERPLTIYEDLAKTNGITFIKGEDFVHVCGKISSGDFTVKGNISSQFITGLLFCLPLLSGNSKIVITEKFESASYVDLTLSALENFGIEIIKDKNVFIIKGRQEFSACDYVVEGDCSNAAFLEAFNFLGGKVKINGLTQNTLQGDKVYKDIFTALKKGEKEFDLSNCPDLAPIVFAMSAVFGGAVFTGTSRLKIKESDRANAMKSELKKFGINVEVFENEVVVNNSTLKKPSEILYGHNDHRIVMALTVLCSITGGTITDAQAVEKSYPNFFEDLKKFKIGIAFDET